MKLSIIIPYYNAKEYTDELLDKLNPQVNQNVEVILVDDGSREPYKSGYKWLKVIRKENGGCASARNLGLNNATGNYVSFIDADDMIPDYFVERLLEKAKESKADVIDFSWKTLGHEGVQHNNKLRSDEDHLKNPSVCTRAFKRSFIGNTRFNELKDSTEDEDFSRKIGYLDPEREMKHVSITDYMYFYRTSVSNSKIKRFKKGLMNTKRVTYYFKHVTADMTDVLEEIKEEDKVNEVWLLTEQCDIPELRKYCQISKPIKIWTHYLKGEPYKNCEVIPLPLKTQVVLYCEFANKIGGISTFMYNFCQQMKEYYDILVLYDRMDPEHVRRLSKIVRIKRNDDKCIVCDTIILNRLTDVIPANVKYKKSIQICHACLQNKYRIPQDRDVLVNVSQAAKETWKEEAAHGVVINNMTFNTAADALLLVSATRMARATDKGDNIKRMRRLAEMLNEKKIPFIWLNFSDGPMNNPPEGFVNMPGRLDVQSYIRKADYLVQLSDAEAYSYATLEALDNNTAVICTPVKSFREQGVIDGKTGYVIPFDMDFDVTRLLEIPRFNFRYNNKERIKQWRELLGDTVPTREYTPEDNVLVEVTRNFTDKYTKQKHKEGEQLVISRERVEEILATRSDYLKVLE